MTATREAFLAERQTGIGATDSPAILGLSRYGTALTVYNRLTQGEKDREPSLPAWVGLKLERTIAEMYVQSTGRRLRADNRHHRHPLYPFIVCHLDYRVQGDRRHLVEVKSRAYAKGWGEDGSQVIPEDVWVQAQHEMMVTDALQCDVAVLIGHHTFRVYPIKRDEAFIDRLTYRLTDFWHDHVVAGVPPEPTGHDLDTEAVSARHPDVTEQVRAATPEQVMLAEALRVARSDVRDAKGMEAQVLNRIKDSIGGALGIEGEFGRITWPLVKGSVSWKTVAGVYADAIDELLGVLDGIGSPDHTDRLEHISRVRQTAKSLYTGEPYRKLDIRFTDEEEETE